MLVPCAVYRKHHSPASPPALIWSQLSWWARLACLRGGWFSGGPLRADTGGAARRGEAGNTYISSGGGMSLVQLQWLETIPGGQLSIWRGWNLHKGGRGKERRRRCREVKWVVLGHRAHQWQSRDKNSMPSCLKPFHSAIVSDNGNVHSFAT